MKEKLTILLIGCGEMGGALLRGWVAQSFPHTFHVITPREESVRSITEQALWFPSLEAYEEEAHNPHFIVFAIRPGLFDRVAPAYVSLQRRSRATLVSVMAGLETTKWEKVFGEDAPLLRVMPNLPAAVLRGVIGFFSKRLQADDYAMGVALFEAIGVVVPILEEKNFNDFTAVLGCGPGIFYEICRALESASNALTFEGKRDDLLLLLIEGSLAYLRKHPASFASLVSQVAVPGGMTEEAIQVLRKKDALEELLKEAFLAASAKGKKLG